MTCQSNSDRVYRKKIASSENPGMRIGPVRFDVTMNFEKKNEMKTKKRAHTHIQKAELDCLDFRTLIWKIFSSMDAFARFSFDQAQCQQQGNKDSKDSKGN